MALENLSLDQLFRDYLVAQLLSGGVGTNVVVTNNVDLSASTLAALENITVTVADMRSLTERMFAKAPQSTHTLYIDTADLTYIYIVEFPVGTVINGQGIRVTKDAFGNPLGPVEKATGVTWATRAAAGWAA